MRIWKDEKNQRKILTAAVDHDRHMVVRTSLLDGRGGSLDVLSSKVGTLGAATENDVDVLVTSGLDDGGNTLLGDTHEGMGVRGRTHGINSNRDAAVGAVLETDGEGDTGSKLTVELRLSGASTDGAPGNEVGDVLR